MTSKRIVLDRGTQRSAESGQARTRNHGAEKVKVFVGSGYEHYEHSGEFLLIDGENLPVFRWCGRTKIAE